MHEPFKEKAKDIDITIRPIDKKDRDNIIKMQNELEEIVRKYGGILSVKDGNVELGWF